MSEEDRKKALIAFFLLIIVVVIGLVLMRRKPKPPTPSEIQVLETIDILDDSIITIKLEAYTYTALFDIHEYLRLVEVSESVTALTEPTIIIPGYITYDEPLRASSSPRVTTKLEAYTYTAVTDAYEYLRLVTIDELLQASSSPRVIILMPVTIDETLQASSTANIATTQNINTTTNVAITDTYVTYILVTIDELLQASSTATIATTQPGSQYY